MFDCERMAQVVHRLLSNKLGWTGLFVLGLLVGLALFAPWIAPFDPRSFHS